MIGETNTGIGVEVFKQHFYAPLNFSRLFGVTWDKAEVSFGQ
jgi:hypothetical protein